MKALMREPRVRLLLGLLAAGGGAMVWPHTGGGQSAPPAVVESATERIEKVLENVYVARPTFGNDSNTVILVNEDTVTIVDAHVTPLRARTLLADVKRITPKPIRELILTHFHHDHSGGAQEFLMPGVQIIGHDYTRQQMTRYNIFEQFTATNFTTNTQRAAAEQAAKQIAAEKDPARRQDLERLQEARLMWIEEYSREVKGMKTTPPDVSFDRTMTLVRGGREIQLLFLGRAHTGGDVIVYLPKEGLIMTGDFSPMGFAGDGWVNEWPDTIGRLVAIPYTRAIPGHGPVEDAEPSKQRYRSHAAYLRDLWSQAAALKQQGLSPLEAAQKLDLSKHLANFPNVPYLGKGGPVSSTDLRTIERVYQVMDGKTDVVN